MAFGMRSPIFGQAFKAIKPMEVGLRVAQPARPETHALAPVNAEFQIKNALILHSRSHAIEDRLAVREPALKAKIPLGHPAARFQIVHGGLDLCELRFRAASAQYSE